MQLLAILFLEKWFWKILEKRKKNFRNVQKILRDVPSQLMSKMQILLKSNLYNFFEGILKGENICSQKKQLI